MHMCQNETGIRVNWISWSETVVFTSQVLLVLGSLTVHMSDVCSIAIQHYMISCCLGVWVRPIGKIIIALWIELKYLDSSLWAHTTQTKVKYSQAC